MCKARGAGRKSTSHNKQTAGYKWRVHFLCLFIYFADHFGFLDHSVVLKILKMKSDIKKTLLHNKK